MKKYKYGLTGEGITMEEVTEMLDGFDPPPMTPEEHKEYLAALRLSTAQFKADMAALESSNGVAVTREDLEREMKRQREQVASEAGDLPGS